MKKDFWFISLIALMVIGFATGWNIPIRIATIANAVVVLIEAFKTIREWLHDRKAQD